MDTEGVHRKRCRRYNFPGHAHELTFSCYRNRAFLSSDRICQYLTDSIVQAREKYDFDLWAYVFMPEHAHLLICPRKPDYSISQILLSIKQSVSRKAIIYLKKHNPNGLKSLATGQKNRPYHFWQSGGGYDRNITSPQTIINAVRYIHNNPVRRELVASAEQWYYSSIRDWQGTGCGQMPIDFDSFPAT
ncbi:MAG TPA: transposase [Sedimentisphaerales bacterium]|nr:transposase [Sedimentisphaerales bacterium]